MTAGSTKGFCGCFRLTTSHTEGEKKTNTSKRGETPSGRHLALSANPTARRRDRGELRRHLSAGLQLGRRGSESIVKGGTAVRSAGGGARGPPAHIYNGKPSSCQTLPLFLYLSVRTTAAQDISSLHLPPLLPFRPLRLRSVPFARPYHPPSPSSSGTGHV